jgi:hypothetical protein
VKSFLSILSVVEETEGVNIRKGFGGPRIQGAKGEKSSKFLCPSVVKISGTKKEEGQETCLSS